MQKNFIGQEEKVQVKGDKEGLKSQTTNLEYHWEYDEATGKWKDRDFVDQGTKSFLSDVDDFEYLTESSQYDPDDLMYYDNYDHYDDNHDAASNTQECSNGFYDPTGKYVDHVKLVFICEIIKIQSVYTGGEKYGSQKLLKKIVIYAPVR